MAIIKFDQALRDTTNVKRHLLLGNGFSIALFPDRFRYGSLLDQADFSQLPEARAVFDAIGTTDFELAAQALKNTAAIIPIYLNDAQALAKIQAHGEALKELLVHAIAGSHPERPSDIGEKQYKACRTFLANFVGDSRVLKGLSWKHLHLKLRPASLLDTSSQSDRRLERKGSASIQI
jgi:Domain of unknown function (DUF4917)